MKILVALDTNEYSRRIIKDVARLAENTLADIIFLGVQDAKLQAPDSGLVENMLRFQQDIYSYFGPDNLPYEDFSSSDFAEAGKNEWVLSSRGLKEFAIYIAGGSMAKHAVALAERSGCNLIILGCNGDEGCEWQGEMNVPLRIAKDAQCSVLVIKRTERPRQIVSILDQSFVSQDSLEMINQLVTLYSAGLKIVGVKEKKKGAKEDDMEKRMVQLLKYYNDLEMNAWVKLIDSGELNNYVMQSSREAIVALWMGKQSLIKRLFSQSMVDRLLETTQSSLLILR